MVERTMGNSGVGGRERVFGCRRWLATGGLAVLAFAALTGAAVASEGSAIECVGYQDILYPPGVTHLMVSNLGTDSLGFEVRYLDLDRTVLRSEQFTLEAGADRDLETATRTAGYAAQVLSTGDLSVSSHVVFVAASGGNEHRAIACTGSAVVL